jgi:hypothetical protein
VTWDWSHSAPSRYDSRVIGTTALRRAAAHTRGFETLVVLSSTILRDPRYSRRLLISTFLHELIHCYLFICCGFRARGCGGHTEGFREIAAVVDEWVGEGGGGLFLTRVEADLELFRVGGGGGGDGGCCEGEGMGMGEGERGGGGGDFGERREVNVYPCSGMAAEQEEYQYAAASAHASAAGPGAQEVGYFRGGSPAPAPGGVRQDAGYFGRGSASPSPGPRPGTPTHEAVYQGYYNDRAAGPVSRSSSPAWWRQRRVVRPLYVYSGDEPTASYVYSNTMGQRP